MQYAWALWGKINKVKFKAAMWCSRKNLGLEVRRSGFNPGRGGSLDNSVAWGKLV